MLNLGLFGFSQPWLLLALLALPGLWLLLRVTPPAPKRVPFPPIEILRRLFVKEETPARTPWWLLLLRMVIAALVILAFARPILDPQPTLEGSGPVVIVVDDGWASARDWPQRQTALSRILEQADRELRQVILVRTARSNEPVASEPVPARDWLAQIDALEPWPWPVDRASVLPYIEELKASLDGASPVTFWLSDGLVGDNEELGDASALALALRQLGPLEVHAPSDVDLPLLLDLPTHTADATEIAVKRATRGTPIDLSIVAYDSDDAVTARTSASLGEDDTQTLARIELPLDLRNRFARIDIEATSDNQTTIASTVLFDESWRRRSVGLVGDREEVRAQPLLAELYFIQRALAPYAEIFEGSIETLLETPLSMIVMPDMGAFAPGESSRLEQWVEEGGVLLRFAGPKLASSGNDNTLIPVPLRAGDRRLGGALSWSEPLAMAPFPAGSPFATLETSEDARIYRQVLARPSPELSDATFATLTDGTPLVTGRQLGSGWIILVHTTANTTWSSLPLSGVFVEMLRATLRLAQGAGSIPQGRFELDQAIDAFGRLHSPDALVPRLNSTEFDDIVIGPNAPPGRWRLAEGLDANAEETPRLALNLQREVQDIIPLAADAYGIDTSDYQIAEEIDISHWLLATVLFLIIVDMMISLIMRGLVPELRRPGREAQAALVLIALGSAAPAAAQSTAASDAMLGATDATHLAYVITGNREVDELSEAGLKGLTHTILRRTSVEAEDPVGIDISDDELAAFPLIYWPVPPDHPNLGDEVLDRVEHYLSHGGMILFDTRDAGELLPGQTGSGSGEQRLGEILGTLNIPPLMPVPQDHVLTRSFYLLQEFPGRWTGRQVWVDDAPEGINDGVASVVIGSHDWAGAWAQDELGQSLLPVMPGGEEQREWAHRFGINLVMYALTGNYKTDQVHVPALLERLGQ